MQMSSTGLRKGLIIEDGSVPLGSSAASSSPHCTCCLWYVRDLTAHIQVRPRPRWQPAGNPSINLSSWRDTKLPRICLWPASTSNIPACDSSIQRLTHRRHKQRQQTRTRRDRQEPPPPLRFLPPRPPITNSPPDQTQRLTATGSYKQSRRRPTGAC